MLNWDFASLRTGKAFSHSPVTKNIKEGPFCEARPVTLDYFDDADAYFVRIINVKIGFERMLEDIYELHESRIRELDIEFLKLLSGEAVCEKYKSLDSFIELSPIRTNFLV